VSEPKPSTRALANIQHPRTLRSLDDLIKPSALPEPHLDDDTTDYSFEGLYGSDEEEAGATERVWARLPAWVVTLIGDVVNDRNRPYRGHISNFVRHAVLELVIKTYQEMCKEIPEKSHVVRHLMSLRMIASLAFKADSVRSTRRSVRACETYIALALERGATEELRRLSARSCGSGVRAPRSSGRSRQAGKPGGRI